MTGWERLLTSRDSIERALLRATLEHAIGEKDEFLKSAQAWLGAEIQYRVAKAFGG